MIRFLGTRVLAHLFGEGLGADIAARGVVYLADGAREAIERPEERLGAVRLLPGDTYSVIARPPADTRSGMCRPWARACQSARMPANPAPSRHAARRPFNAVA